MARIISSSELINSGAATAGRPFLLSRDAIGMPYRFTIDEIRAQAIRDSKASVLVLNNQEAKALAEQAMPNLEKEGTFFDKYRNAQMYLASGKPIHVGNVGITEAQDRRFNHDSVRTEVVSHTVARFGDGRHRTRALIDAGVADIPVVINHAYLHHAADYYAIPRKALPISTRIADTLAEWVGSPKPKDFGYPAFSNWAQTTREDGPERLTQLVGQLTTPGALTPPNHRIRPIYVQ